LQQHGLVLAIDPRTGETQVHAELADPRWVSPIPGTPAYLGDGRVLVGGELAHDGYDARCLFADGTLLTPPSLYVHRVCARLRAGVLYPRQHVADRKLPVLVDIYGGPGRQDVLAARWRWLERQWWADAGFAVVTIDNRGTPGVSPSFEKAVHRRLADVVLGD